MRRFLLLLTLAFTPVLLTACSSEPEKAAAAPDAVPVVAEGRFFCKVCKTAFDKAGSCPRCGMQLTGKGFTGDAPVVMAGQPSGTYFCKLCKTTSAKGGSCSRCGMPLVSVQPKE